MKVLFLSPSISRKLGGVFEVERSLTLELHRQGVNVQVAGLEDEHWAADRPRWLPLEPRAHPVKGPASFGYSPALARQVLGSDAELLHLHALWMYPSVLARRWASATSRPYLVTPHGMLEPWALANSKWKKKIAGALYENRMLTGANCLQATNPRECVDFRSYGLRNPVAVIPNGVDLPDEEGGGNVAVKREGREGLLFLGRLHPKKGLPAALRAWKEVAPGNRDWQLIIAGWDQGGHDVALQSLCDELGLRWEISNAAQWAAGGNSLDADVVFTGPAFGADKTALLKAASAFILPSVSEGLPVAVLEAWSHRLPVVMTEPCNLPDGFEAGAAIQIGTDVAGIAEGCRTLFAMTADERADMGMRGRQLVESRYTWNSIGTMMHETYDWMLGGGNAPSFVEFQQAP